MLLSGCGIRCSVVTETGKVATYVDETISHPSTFGKLEHPASLYSEFTIDRIVKLYTCSLYTVVKLDSGALYWW